MSNAKSNCKNSRIECCLQSKKFKFFDRNEKKIGGYFLKKMHFCKIFSVPEPVTYVFLQGPKTSTLGPLLPWSEKKSGLTQKSYKFFVCSFAMAPIN